MTTPVRAHWTPRFSPGGIVGGVLMAFGTVVLMQQSAYAYPTRSLVLWALLLGVVGGIVLPSLGRLYAVHRWNAWLDTEYAAMSSTPVTPLATEPAPGWTYLPTQTAAWHTPSEQPDPDLWLPAGTPVTVVDWWGEWAHVTTATGDDLWIDGVPLRQVS